MIFAGYVPLRRGLLDHTMRGRLSSLEAIALTVLILLADKSTGRGYINGPVLRTYLPDFSRDAAKRVLESLEDKGYIYRQIVTRSTRIYPYWVNRFIPSTGPHKLLQLSLEQVFESKDIKDIKYIKAAPESAPEGAPESAPDPAPEGAHYNKKDKEKEKEKENPLIVNGEYAYWCDSNSSSGRPMDSMTMHTSGQRGAHVASRWPHDGAHVASHQGVGMRWDGAQGGYVDANSGMNVPWKEARKRIANVGLEQFGDKFFDLSTKAPVAWNDAQTRISGPIERKVA